MPSRIISLMYRRADQIYAVQIFINISNYFHPLSPRLWNQNSSKYKITAEIISSVHGYVREHNLSNGISYFDHNNVNNESEYIHTIIMHERIRHHENTNCTCITQPNKININLMRTKLM